MKLKLVILLSTLYILYFTFAYTQDTIIDSVYADPLLDGEIQFFTPTQEYVVVNGVEYDTATAGDSGFENIYARSFYSFEIPSIPVGYHIDSVYTKITEFWAVGNGSIYNLPIWDVPNGDTISCIMSHIDYGDELDVSDWTHGDYNSPYTYHYDIGITITDSTDFLYTDVTNCVLDDIANQRLRSQYRIAFEIDTDWDYMSDNVIFVTSEVYIVEWRPQIYFVYKENVAVKEETKENSSIYLSISPNPANSMMQISYTINQPTFVSLKFYNIKGQLIKTAVNEYQNSGLYSATWNAENQSSGIYFYKITAGIQTATGKCLLLK
jgi:hypothetical protein